MQNRRGNGAHAAAAERTPLREPSIDAAVTRSGSNGSGAPHVGDVATTTPPPLPLPGGTEVSPCAAAEAGAPEPAALTVFFEGTANTLDPLTTQIGLFFVVADAEDVTRRPPGATPSGRPQKMGFDGCGVTDGCAGTLFAAGLRRQCAVVRAHVDALVADRWRRRGRAAAAPPVRVNAVGLSRGGIGVLFLAQTLADLPRTTCELSILIFDPVPGNLFATVQCDLTGFTVAKECCDVSHCACLVRVLAIYPNEPLPAISCHAPVLCRYPASCEVEEEVTLGCHQGALFMHGIVSCRDIASCLSFLRIQRWLADNGCAVKLSTLDAERISMPAMEEACLRGCERVLQEASGGTSRAAHCAGSWRGAQLVRGASPGRARHLNRHHALLAAARTGAAAEPHAAAPAAEEWLLRVRRDRAPFPSGFLFAIIAAVGVLIYVLHSHGMV